MKRVKIHNLKVYCTECKTKITELRADTTTCPHCGSELFVKVKHLKKFKPDLFLQDVVKKLEAQGFIKSVSLKGGKEDITLVNPFKEGIVVNLIVGINSVHCEVNYSVFKLSLEKTFRIRYVQADDEFSEAIIDEQEVIDFIQNSICSLITDNQKAYLIHSLLRNVDALKGFYITRVIPTSDASINLLRVYFKANGFSFCAECSEYMDKPSLEVSVLNGTVWTSIAKDLSPEDSASKVFSFVIGKPYNDSMDTALL